MRRSLIHSLVRLTTVCLLICAVVMLVAARAQKAQPLSQQEIDRGRAIEAVRLINAAEYDYRSNYGHFGAWTEVFDSKAVRNLLHTWPRIDELSIAPSDEVIPGFRLSLLVGDEGAAYSVTLREMKGNGCGISVFSDQSGLIYEGKVVECPQITDHPGRFVD